MTKKSLIVVFLIILIGNFVLGGACYFDGYPSNAEVNVGIYEKISTEDGFFFKKSESQPNSKAKVVKKGDVLIVETFNISINQKCYTRGEEAYLKIYSPNLNETVRINLVSILSKINENISETFYYSSKLEKNFTNKDLEYSLNYTDSKGNFDLKNYVTLDMIGEWKVELVIDQPLFKNVFNEGGSIRTINVLDRLDVVQLEVLEQLRKESKKSSRQSLIFVVLIGLFTIIIMWITSERQIKKMEEHHKKEIEIKNKQEEEKQISIL